MRICITFHEEAEKELTGDHKRVIGIARALKNLGHDVCLIEGASDNQSVRYKGIKIIHVKSLFARKQRMYAHKILSVIDRILHIHGTISKLSYLLLDDPFITIKATDVMAKSNIVIVMGDLTIAPLIGARILNKKVMLDVIGFYLQSVYRMKQYIPFYSYYGRLVFLTLLGKLGYHLADKVIVPSYDDARNIIQILKLPENRIDVIPNGIDTSLFKPHLESRERVRKMLGLDASDTLVLFLGGDPGLGNTSAVKYITRILAPSIRAKYDNVFFAITGSWASYGGDSGIIITGYVDDVVGYINAADLCIAPLTVGSGTKIKMLAYMACEKITIATPVAAEGINVSDGDQALIYDINTFTDGVLYAIENRAELIDLAKNARTHIEKHFSWSRIENDLNRLMLALTKESESVNVSP